MEIKNTHQFVAHIFLSTRPFIHFMGLCYVWNKIGIGKTKNTLHFLFLLYEKKALEKNKNKNQKWNILLLYKKPAAMAGNREKYIKIINVKC